MSERRTARKPKPSQRIIDSRSAPASSQPTVIDISSAESSPASRTRSKRKIAQPVLSDDEDEFKPSVAVPKRKEEEEEEEEEEERPAKRQKKKLAAENQPKVEEDEEEGEGEGEEEEEEEEEERPAKRQKKKPAAEDEEERTPEEIVVNLSVFSAKQFVRPPKARNPSASSTIFKFFSNLPYYKFEKLLLRKINDVAKLTRTLDEDDGIPCEFQVPRKVTNYVQLNLDGFEHMIKSALQSGTPTINLAAGLPKADAASDDDDDSDVNKKKKKKAKKSKVPSEKDITPVNTEINNKIGILRTKYACHANDGSDYCWVSAEENEHVPLGHPHFNMWAAGWAQGICDEHTPPNHAIFSKDKAGRAAGQTAAPSVLQRRIAAQAQTPGSSSSPIINNHFTLPDALLNALRPVPVAAMVPVASHLPIDTTHAPLLPANTTVGPSMLITDFCGTFELDDSIAEKLGRNGYRKSDGFKHILLKDLTAIEFLPGEVVELREAVEKWATPKLV
ncbi:hypothetical protein B0H16DRAFT_1468224 [Mycena metata]|uniref:Uncharacterized protein n=1 Tax=Mycena metata TaxID=1033252 RepID=A0AAD7I1Y3_9AGAR|nr:hypothetical protein B0H16DRAFT_1468224 [Mycena metata]